jgi:uncharacterized SAM-binding protein YcdF (DUF218 family)
MRKLLVACVVIAAILAVAVGALRYAGEFLVRRDAFGDADVAVVLSGEPGTRTLAARDLYRERRVRRIVVIPEAQRNDATRRELEALGITPPPPLPPRILLASGIPPAAFDVLPEPIDGTIEEARRIKRHLEGTVAPRIAVITSKFASRRACLIFRRVLRDREIFCLPTPYDPFEPREWWRQPRDALNVVVEYQKLAANALMLLVSRS